MQLFNNITKPATAAFRQRTLNYPFHFKCKIHIQLIFPSNAMHSCIYGKHLMMTGSYPEKQRGLRP